MFFFVTLKYTSFSELFSNGIRFGRLASDVPALFDNENMVALFALISLSLCFLMIYSRFSPIKYGIFATIFLFFGLLTSSKTFLLCLIALIVYYTICIGKSEGLKNICVLALIGIITFIVLRNTIIWNEVQRVMLRFEAADITTGRAGLITQYNSYISTNFLTFIWGVGVQDISRKTGIRLSPHNAIQEIIVCWGIIGLLLVLSLIVELFHKTKRDCQYSEGAIYYASVIVFLLFIQTIQFVSNSAIFGLLLILFLSVHICRVNKGE